jgi:lipopolysaccharide assembly outer membrane protein LptD (OstA)
MRFLPALTVAVLLTMAAAPLAAQVDAGTCQLVDSRLVERRVQDGVATLYVTGPALARCAGDVEIRADSAVLLEATAEIRLFRNVLFRDPLRQLTSDRATYFDGPGRLHAVGNVEFVDRERGSTLTGPELDYFRETEARPEPRVVAIGRPRLVLVPETAPGAEPEEPFTVDADRMVVEGDDRLTASGRVEIARSDFDGSGREAFTMAVASSWSSEGMPASPARRSTWRPSGSRHGCRTAASSRCSPSGRRGSRVRS